MSSSSRAAPTPACSSSIRTATTFARSARGTMASSSRTRCGSIRGQHLGRGRGNEHGHQVQSRGTGRDGARPQAGSRRGCGRDGHWPAATGREVHVRPPDGCRLGPAGQHFCLRRIHQSPRGEVRQERQVHHAGGQREDRVRSPASSTLPHGIAVDAQGNVYVADRANHRMQVFDNNLGSRQSTTTSAIPGPFAFRPARTSTCSPPTPTPTATRPGRGTSPARSTRWNWTGRSSAGSAMPASKLGGFQVVHMMDCRNPNEIFVAEIESWRVQKLLLKPLPAAKPRPPDRRRIYDETIFPDFAGRDAACRHPGRRPVSRAGDRLRFRRRSCSSSRTTSHLGEVAGVATNSKGDIFVYTRTGHPTITIGTSRPFAHGGSRLFQFDRNGKFVREIGQDSYGFLVAQQVRVDPQDNIWIVDQMSSMVIKFDSERAGANAAGPKGRSRSGSRLCRSHRKPLPARPEDGAVEPVLRPRPRVPAAAGRGLPGAGAQSDIFQRPTDVAWDAAGNIYVADGYGNARVAKFDKNGKFIKSWGSRGVAPGPVQPVARYRARCAGQRLCRRRRKQANSGLRQRRELQEPDPNVGNSLGDLHLARAASIPLQLEFKSAERYRL